MDADRSGNWFVRVAGVVGDLSNPFYREERQRDVWNEASAVALQVLLWLGLLAATAAVWVVGSDAVPYVYALLAMIGVAGWIAILYAWSLGVHVESSGTAWSRIVPLLVVSIGLALGLARVHDPDLSDDWVTLAGMVTGAGAVLAVVAVAARYARRQTRAREED